MCSRGSCGTAEKTESTKRAEAFRRWSPACGTSYQLRRRLNTNKKPINWTGTTVSWSKNSRRTESSSQKSQWLLIWPSFSRSLANLAPKMFQPKPIASNWLRNGTKCPRNRDLATKRLRQTISDATVHRWRSIATRFPPSRLVKALDGVVKLGSRLFLSRLSRFKLIAILKSGS